jgi:hypothetical protein
MPLPAPAHIAMHIATREPSAQLPLIPRSAPQHSSNSETEESLPCLPCMSTEIPYAPAVVQQQSASHTAVLSAGHVTIAAMRIFENACHRYFQHKLVAEADCVLAVIYNFEGLSVQSWINMNLARLTELTFPLFILKFKKKFLPRNWQDDLISTQIGLQGTVPFLAWTEAVREQYFTLPQVFRTDSARTTQIPRIP